MAEAPDRHEFRDLAGIYAAIDRAVQANPDLADRLSVALPLYRKTNPLWVEGFLKGSTAEVQERTGDDPSELPSLEEALDHLSQLPTEARTRSRRLLAVAAARLAFPDLAPDTVQIAAHGRGLAGTLEDQERSAQLLVERIDQGAEPGLGRRQWWNALTADDGIVPETHQIGPPPCSGRVVWAKVDGHPAPVVLMKTVFNSTIPFDDAKEFVLKPENWEKYPGWCDMQKIGDDTTLPKHYREIVSFDCDDPQMLKLAVNLDFMFKDEPGPPPVASAEYRLSPMQTEKRVLVNAGSLEVRELPGNPGEIRVTTTKRICFSPELGGPGLAHILCMLGYLSQVEDLLWCASGQTDTFPGHEPDDDSDSDYQKGSQVDPERAMATATIKRMADAAQVCIDDWAKDMKASWQKIGTGKYGADDLIQDMANAWVQMLASGATFAQVGFRRPRTPPRRPGQPSPPGQQQPSPAGQQTSSPVDL